MKFDDLTNGQTKAVIAKLGGPDVAMALLRGGLEVRPKGEPATTFPLWRTFSVGGYADVKEIKAAFQATGRMYLQDEVVTLLKKEPLGLSGQVDVDFVRLKAGDLGFTEPVLWRDVLAAGQKRGLHHCQPEDVIAVCMGYTDQRVGECLHLAAAPFGRNWMHGWARLMVATDQTGRWVRGDTLCYNIFGDERGFWPDSEFIFRK